MKFREKILQLIDVNNPPELTLHVRKSALKLSELQKMPVWAEGIQSEPLRGLLFLWHDHGSESHAIAQSHEGVRDYDLLHAILHRREADYSNSNYWFRSVGHHPLFGNLSVKIKASFAKDADLIHKVLPSGKWDPGVFIRLVKQDAENPRLRSIQGMEFECFLEHLLTEAL